MKLQNQVNYDGRNIGELKELKSTISDKNMGLALTMMSKNLYSDPIGSFIREITSNAVDANVDANIDEPVMIHIYEEDEAYFIEFKDNGTGMSPEIFNEIYMSWFESDKRETNDKIGGWGLGSKSPLAYQPYFEIITRSNGIQYEYVFSNESTEPKAELINESPTDLRNGTTIRIELKEEDLYQVNKDCKKQLAYFKTVYVKDDINYYDNTFKIYEHNNWLLRNRNQPFESIHICLGQVTYPINWSVLDREPIYLPLALKFNTGDLPVTINREEINYDEGVKVRLNHRIDEVVEEITKIYNEQTKIDDLLEYFKLVSDRDKPNLIIEDVSIKMRGFKSDLIFAPFPELRVKHDKAHLLFSKYEQLEIKGGKLEPTVINNYQFRHHLSSIYLVRGKQNFYDTAYIGSGYLLRPKKINRIVFRRFAEMLGLIDSDNVNGQLVRGVIYKKGAALQVSKVLKYIDNYLDIHLRKYDNICPEWWKEDYRRKQREENALKKDTITYYTSENRRYQDSLEQLISNNKVVFIIDRKNKRKKIVLYEYIYNGLPKYIKRNSKFLIVSTTTYDKLIKLNKFYDVCNIFKVKSLKNYLYKYKMSYLIYTEIHKYKDVFNYSDYYRKLYYELNNKFLTDHNPCLDYINKEGNYIKYNPFIYLELQEQFDSIVPTKDYYKYHEIFKTLKNVISKLKILQYLNNAPRKIIASIIIGTGVTKMNKEYYKR